MSYQNPKQWPVNFYLIFSIVYVLHDLLFFAASAPTRTLGRRKLVRNRFTIDTDIVFDGEPEQDLPSPQEPDSNRLQQHDKPDQQQQPELAGDTDRWVEEQFDLEEYEDQEELKETDILSDDDDEFCKTPRASSIEVDLETPVMALSLASEETEESESLKSPSVSETPDDIKLIDENVEQTENDEIWVRRKQSGSSPDGAT